MSILARTFLASYLGLFATILFASLVAVSAIDVLLNFDDVFERFGGTRGIFDYLLLRVPSYYLRDLIPATSFAAAFFCFGLAARAREITALKTGGVSPLAVAAPVLGMATVLSAGALALNETLVLDAARAWNRLEHPGEDVSFRRGSFWYHKGNAIYNVREADAATGTLRGVSVFELSPNGRLVRSTHAATAWVTDGREWHLSDATSRSFDPTDPLRPPHIERVADALVEVADRRDLARIEDRAENLSLAELVSYADARAREGRDAQRVRARLHARLAEPLAVPLFALLAVPLGLAVERRRSLATCALLGIAVLGAYYTARTMVQVTSAAGLGPGPLAPWLLLAAFAAFGAFRLARAPR